MSDTEKSDAGRTNAFIVGCKRSCFSWWNGNIASLDVETVFYLCQQCYLIRLLIVLLYVTRSTEDKNVSVGLRMPV